MVKILGVCGSPRSGATEAVVRHALETAAKKPGVETAFITLKGKKIAPCNGCGACRKNKSWCVMQDDMQDLLDEFLSADAYLVASPVYVHTVTPQLMAFFTRMRPLHHVFPDALRTKVGAALAVGGTRNGGEEFAVNTIIHLMMTRGVNIVSNEIGGYIGGKVWSHDIKAFTAADDEVGIATVESMANKLADIACIMKKGLEAGEAAGARDALGKKIG